MRKQLLSGVFSFFLVANSEAAVWVKLQEKNGANLMLDKQSVLEKDALKRAWVKITYSSPQVNEEVADKTYNLSKLLWFFDCPAQKAATSQVFQYSNDELIFSAAVDSKLAKFIEPVPETEVDIAMRYVCDIGKTKIAETDKSVAAKPNSTDASKPIEATAKESVLAKPADNAADKVLQSEQKSPEGKKEVAKDGKVEAKPSEKNKAADNSKSPVKPVKDGHAKHWTYEGEEGPDNWGKINPEFATCDTGKNQSPINIDKTIKSVMKPLKTLQKFPGKDIVNNGHTVQISFKEGNMMVLDDAPFQMKYLNFHTPSEHNIKGKSYPLEAHFVHANSKGELTVIGVMYEEGKPNEALGRLWQQMPKEKGEAIPLKSRVLPSELIPQSRGYYRFSGSLTTPPCSEGVRWVMMKTPMTVSKEQIETLKAAVHDHNNRPVQALNGRAVLE